MAKEAPKKDTEFVPARERNFTIPDLESLPNLANMTEAAMIDWFGIIKDLKKAVEAQEKFMNTALKARIPIGEARQGYYYSANIVSVQSTRIDTEKARTELDEDTLAKISTTSSALTLYCKKK